MDEPVGALKGLAREGQITRDVVLRALQDIEKNGGARLADVLDTPASKLAKLNARLDDLRVELGELSLPAFIGLVERLTSAVEQLTGKVETWQLGLQNINRALKDIEGSIPSWVTRFNSALVAISQNLNPLLLGLKTADFLLGRAAQKERDLLGPAPTEYDRTQGADLNMDAIRQMSQQIAQQQQNIIDPFAGADSTAADEALETLNRQLAAGKELSTEFSRQLELLKATNDIERELAQMEFDRLDRMEAISEAAESQRAALEQLSNDIYNNEFKNLGTSIGTDLANDAIELKQANEDALRPLKEQKQLLEAKLNGTEEEVRLRLEVDRIMRDQQGLEGSMVEELVRGNAELQKRVDLMDKFKQTLAQAGQLVASALTDSIGTAIDGLINGADDLNKKLQEIASTLLRDLGSLFLRAGINAAAGPGGLFGPNGLPGFANGGVIPMGTTAVVGEQGPEILTVRPNGTIVTPNSPFVDAAAETAKQSSSGTSKAYAASAQAMDTATATMAANYAAAQERQEMAEFAAQSTSSSSSILVETTLVDQIEVVTVEQLNRATKASAKQAEANVMRGLRNRPAVRGKAGV